VLPSCAHLQDVTTALHPAEGVVQDLERRGTEVIQCSRDNAEMEEKRGKHHHAHTSYWTGFSPIEINEQGSTTQFLFKS